MKTSFWIDSEKSGLWMVYKSSSVKNKQTQKSVQRS